MKWERSSWTKLELLEEERLRYALIAPRLLAPHPNRGAGETLRPDQALALAVQVRVRELQDYADDLDDVPKLSELDGSHDWSWRFVGAFIERLVDDVPDPLSAVARDAPGPSSRAAASVAAACALLDSDRVEDALALIETALSVEGYANVDHAWLEAQRARFCHQIGRLQEALDAAKRARILLKPVQYDATADAIDAGAASLILSITRHKAAESFEEAVIAGDTVATWWRVQTISSANGAVVDRAFEKWAHDKRITVGAEDVANNRMLSAALMTSHAVDHNGWANRTAALGRDELLRLDRHADPEEVSAGLNTLRRAGDHKALQLAVSHVAADGPAVAVAETVNAVDLSRTTRTTALADLTVLQRGGDLLDTVTADRAVSWLLATLADPTAFAERTTPTFLLELQLVETLVGVIPSASHQAHEAVIEQLLEMPGEGEQLIAQEWANLIWSIPAEAWNEPATRRATRAATRHHPLLERALFGIAARHGRDPEARTRLLDEARRGSTGALGELGSVTELPTDVAADVIARLAGSVRKRIEEAKGNRISFGGRDPSEALAVMNLWHLDVAQWEPLVELLGTEAVPDAHMVRTLGVLASNSNRVPSQVVERLRPIISGLIERPPSQRSPFESGSDVCGPALDFGVTIGAIDSEKASEIALDWLAKEADKRRWAAYIAYRLRRCEDTGLLTALANDHDPDVRAAAAAALAAILPPSAGDDNAVAQGLRAALRDPGTKVPAGIASALTGRIGAVAEEVRRELRRHISATVRSLASQEPDPDSAGESDLNPRANPLMSRFPPSEKGAEGEKGLDQDGELPDF